MSFAILVKLFILITPDTLRESLIPDKDSSTDSVHRFFHSSYKFPSVNSASASDSWRNVFFGLPHFFLSLGFQVRTCLLMESTDFLNVYHLLSASCC